jgi:hypothetical protein
MPAAKKLTGTPGPKTSPRAAPSARPSLTPHKITAANLAFGFAAFNLMFVIVILLLLEIVATPQLYLTFGARAWLPILVFNTGGVIGVLLLLLAVKGCAETRWYGTALGVLLQFSLAIFLYPVSKPASLLISLGVLATVFGAIRQKWPVRRRQIRTM